MSDYTRPLLLGYVREHFLMAATELAQAKQQLADFAAVEGFALQAIYVEHVETAPAAFQALVEAATRFEARAVVVPSLKHFAALGAPASMKDRLERATGARVLVAEATP